MSSLQDHSGGRMTHINGVSIEGTPQNITFLLKIESRSTPLEDSKADSVRYRVRSSAGFLDPGESLLDRLDKDQAAVVEIHVTHHHLASQLERLLMEATHWRKANRKGPDALATVTYRYHPYEEEKISVEEQNIMVAHRSFAGAQWSFFRNLNRDGPETEEDTISWKEDHEIYNSAFPHIKLTIAGGVGTGICHYINKYGFYEGGKTNPYRVDPALLHFVLTGVASQNALSASIEFYEESKRKCQARFDADVDSMKSNDPPLDENTFASFLQFLQTNLDNELFDLDAKLDATRALKKTKRAMPKSPP